MTPEKRARLEAAKAEIARINTWESKRLKKAKTVSSSDQGAGEANKLSGEVAAEIATAQ